MIDVDIPQLSSSGIQFGRGRYGDSFEYTYSIQSSSTYSPISLSFDATALELYIKRRSGFIKIELADMISSQWVVENGQYMNNNNSLSISGNSNLKRIVIGDDCFGKVRVFELDGLNELENVVIGQRSFTYPKQRDCFLNHYRDERTDGTCRIVNCPKLQSIRFGGNSFSDYHSFELTNLPSLQSIEIGECFQWAPTFSLIGLID